MHKCLLCLLNVCPSCLWSDQVLGQSESTVNASETAVCQAAESYVQAFNARDACALAKRWSPQGIYINRSTGDRIVGRETLTEEFSNMFAGDDLPTLTKRFPAASRNHAADDSLA
ncbi:MAG: nuclear transport factor 2 family protein [Fuerstiella sp.]|nr:nuclear transport factor 2 family protein [Fuerstiella sp.]